MKKFGSGKTKTRTENRGLIVGGVIALMFALALWGVMIFMENMVLGGYEKVNVYVASENIGSGTKTKDSMLKKAIIDKALLPATAIKEYKDIENLIAKTDIPQNAVLTSDMFGALDNKAENSQLLGLAGTDLAKVVNGVLRSSDVTDIYFVGEEMQSQTNTLTETGEIESVLTQSNVPCLKNITVDAAFNKEGTVIPNSDKDTPASSVNIVVTPEQAEQIMNYIITKQLVIVKHEK